MSQNSSFKLSEIFKPKLFTIIKQKQYDKKTFLSDLSAGLIVGIVAIPLAIAFAIASGVSPQSGIITAVIAGFIISFLGGSRYQIGGPTGAFIVIVYGILVEYGMSGLIIATVLAGVMLIIMGVLKLGNIIKFMPYPIIVGFTSGIAVVIFSSQVKDFLGLQMGNVPSEFIDKWKEYFAHIHTINIWAVLISTFTILIILSWNKVYKKIPGSLVAIIFVSTIVYFLREHLYINVETIGSKFPELAGGAPLPTPEAPTINMKAIRMLIQPAFTIAMLGAIESLLSAMVADGATGGKHRSNTELIAQGVANIVTPIFGGIPATGAIARTMTNISNGGKTPIAGIIHAIFLLLIYFFLMPLAVHIPLACLAGVLAIICYNMCEWRSFKALLKNPRSDVAVLLTTFLLTVIFDLTIAIEIGLLIALFMFLRRVMETSGVSVINNEIIRTENDEELDAEALDIPDGVQVFEINGPFFFGIANRFDDVSVEIGQKKIKARIIRMRRVPFVDSTGLHNLRNLWKKSQKEKIQLILSGVNSDVLDTLKKSGFADEIGEEFICENITMAIEEAKKVVFKNLWALNQE